MKFFLVLMFLGSLSYAGIRDVGNGGVGVLINETPYLLDLYEAGMTVPYFQSGTTSLPQFHQRAQKMTILSSAEKILLSQKLTELEHISPLVANKLAVGLEMFVWRLLAQDLIDIPERSPIDLKPLKVVQLANRFGSTVRISQKYWQMMDSGNRVALILHELFYAYAELVPLENNTFEQQSAPVREIIGYVFSPELSQRGIAGFEKFTSIPRRNSILLANSDLETVGDSFFATSDVFAGAVSLFTTSNDDRWVFCNNLAAALQSSKKSSTSGRVFYETHKSAAVFEDYLSPTGLQKKLTLSEDPATFRQILFGGFSFNKNNLNTCSAWIEKTVQQIRALPDLP